MYEEIILEMQDGANAFWFFVENFVGYIELFNPNTHTYIPRSWYLREMK